MNKVVVYNSPKLNAWNISKKDYMKKDHIYLTKL